MMGIPNTPHLVRKFIWVQPNGRCMILLDRALVSEDWGL